MFIPDMQMVVCGVTYERYDMQVKDTAQWIFNRI
jgi:hypothetical protein